MCSRRVYALQLPPHAELSAHERHALYLVDKDPRAEVGVAGEKMANVRAEPWRGGRRELVDADAAPIR